MHSRKINEDRYFTKTSLAQYLDRSTRWVDRWLASDNPPPGLKVKTHWLFKKSEIDAWLESHRRARG